MEIKINDLQKRIHQLDQDIGEKENECQKLREELTMVKEQSEILTQNSQVMETKYSEDQQKWAKLCDRVNTQMEEHKFVYSSKFPIDPFQRDHIFHQSSSLSHEMNASHSQRKQFNIAKP